MPQVIVWRNLRLSSLAMPGWDMPRSSLSGYEKSFLSVFLPKRSSFLKVPEIPCFYFEICYFGSSVSSFVMIYSGVAVAWQGSETGSWSGACWRGWADSVFLFYWLFGILSRLLSSLTTLLSFGRVESWSIGLDLVFEVLSTDLFEERLDFDSCLLASSFSSCIFLTRPARYAIQSSISCLSLLLYSHLQRGQMILAKQFSFLWWLIWCLGMLTS